jgi:dihydrofolate synthase/folylpolyglutamate synthase
MAVEYFKREKVDYAVIETGMGGRWDATNVIRPVLSVITRIDFDHAEYLGTDIEKIAWEKAGIIKPGVPVICGPMPVEAEAVVYKEAAEKKVPILGSDEAVFFQCLEKRRTDSLVDIEASGSQYNGVRLPLGGSFQLENCGIAVAALEDLSDLEGIRLDMKKGLEAVKWPGRFQMLSMKPPIIYDGAHNPSGARALFQTLEEIFPTFASRLRAQASDAGIGFFFSFMKDKDVKAVLETFAPAVAKAWAFTMPGTRAMPAEEIVAIGKSVGIDIEPVDTPQVALDWLDAGKKRLVCFTGSLYLPEELKKHGLFNG